MFKCERCKCNSELYEKQSKVINLTREKFYYNVAVLNPATKVKEIKNFSTRDPKILDDLREAGFKVLKDWVTRGSEIVNENKLCSKCINMVKGA